MFKNGAYYLITGLIIGTFIVCGFGAYQDGAVDGHFRCTLEDGSSIRGDFRTAERTSEGWHIVTKTGAEMDLQEVDCTVVRYAP